MLQLTLTYLMQMKKEYSEPGEYDFFPETYMLPQELGEYKRQFHLSLQKVGDAMNQEKDEIANQIKEKEKDYMR